MSVSPERPIEGPRIVTPLGFRPNAHFVGFQDELKRLHKRLQHEVRRDMGSCAVLVWGEVGCGKTHLTRQYFYKHRQEYPHGSFWIDCKTTETITKGLWDIGVSIGALEHERDRRTIPPGPDNFADVVRQRLEAMHGWLLVFDGILFESEESLDAFRKYIPDQSGNCIIFTSVDRTLTHRHRLLNPSALKVGKLAVGDAIELLYRNLGIRHPTNTQAQKALELVKDNDYLPLGIHAAAHALIEHGKALERYTHLSTDLRLITPFLDIISGLINQGRDEAVNLVNLLSFFTHHVPVALVRYGLQGLTEFPYEIDVLSPKYANSSRTDLDSSISILMRSGLLERTLQTWSRSSGSSSPEESKSLKRGTFGQSGQTNGQRSIVVRTLEDTPPAQVTEESSGLDDMVITRFESRGTRASAASAQSVLDTLRIHTVVQNVIRDDLKEKPLMGEHDYWWWLGAAVRLLTRSYKVACEKMRKSTGPGLVRDYREYEAQAARLLSSFPKTSSNATMELRHARHDIRTLLKMVKREIENKSPSLASDSSGRRLYQESVFERSSITSDENQSPSMSSPSRASTWSLEPERTPSESPTQMHSQLHSAGELDPVEDTDMHSNAVLSDDESWPALSDTTETPNHALLPRSRRSSVLHAVLEGKPKLRQHKDLGEWKALAVPPSISQPEVHLIHSSRTSSETRSSRPSSSSEAEAALAAMHRSSPPASRGTGRLRSTSRGSMDRPALAARSPNTTLTPLVQDFQPMGYAKSGNVNKPLPRNPSSSPRLVQALLNSQAHTRARHELPPLVVENITMECPTNGSERPRSSHNHPTSLVESPVPMIRYLPSGYTSVPMSRDTSHESVTAPHAAVASDYSKPGSAPQRTFSDPHVLGVDAPGTYGFNLQNSMHYSEAKQGRGRQNLDFGQVGEWANIAPSEPGQATIASLTLEEEVRRTQVQREVLQFGEMEPVSIDEARARVSIARGRSADSSARGRSRGGRSNNHSERGH